MIRRLLCVAVLVVSSASVAQAADVAVTVINAQGRPAANAVVMVYPKAAARAGPIRFPWPLVMNQRNMQFDPFVLVAPVGAEVLFPNRDPFRHHVYSFSPAKPFELKLYGHDETRVVKFDKPGVVALGCNIHDQMSAFIRVVDTPFSAKTDARGELVLHDLPAGRATVVLWHPYIVGGDVARSVNIPAAGTLPLRLLANIGRAPMQHDAY